MKNYKKILLTLFLFLCILLLKNTCFAVTLDFSTYPELSQFSDIEPLTLNTETNSYLVVINDDLTNIRVLEASDPQDYLTTVVYSRDNLGTYNRTLGYSLSYSSLRSCITHRSNYVNGSWTSWGSIESATSPVDNPSGYGPGLDGHTYIDKSNVLVYFDNFGIIENKILSSGIPLPDDIKLTDNIVIFRHSLYDNEGIYLLYSNNMDNNFRLGTEFTCVTSSGYNDYFDLYKFNSSTNLFEFVSNTNSYNTGLAVGNEYYYSTNDIYNGASLLNYAFEDFFDFYYEDEEYIFPYIADTDEVLSNLDNVDKILVFPGSLTKDNLPMRLDIIDKTNEELIYQVSLDTSSPFYLYIVENPSDYWFEVPTSEFKDSLINGNLYHFNIYAHNDYNEFNILREITYKGTTVTPPTDEEIQTDAINNQTQKIEEQTNAIINQTEKIEEQTEVQKNIFERIGDILSYINPLSENFFAYKLIDLLIDALKSLFVPEERISR